jgi:5-(carboxyamino)imidazole ribonucleotide mutase
MPGGIPVATVAIGKAGAKNAGLLAAQILSAFSEEVEQKLAVYRKAMKQAVIESEESW